MGNLTEEFQLLSLDAVLMCSVDGFVIRIVPGERGLGVPVAVTLDVLPFKLVSANNSLIAVVKDINLLYNYKNGNNNHL